MSTREKAAYGLMIMWSLGPILVLVLMFAGADGTGRLVAWTVVASLPVLLSVLLWAVLFSPQKREVGEPVSDAVWSFQLRRAERSLRRLKAHGATTHDVLDGGTGAEWMEKYCLGDRELAQEAFRRVYDDRGDPCQEMKGDGRRPDGWG